MTSISTASSTNEGWVLTMVGTGKVRDIYKVTPHVLLFFASDRISAYDEVMYNCIPKKGIVLTYMTIHWIEYLKSQIPDLKTHYITHKLPDELAPNLVKKFEHRSMLVAKYRVFPIEAIVRGYITGSAWQSYQKTGEVNGVKLPPGLKESQQLPEPIYTPSTKAEYGLHDENISIERAAEIVGPKYAKRIEELALKIYTVARDYAKEKGIIIADTKFEFGHDEETDEVVLIDEVLTPDSSRFWSVEKYEVGRSQDSFDKQGLRDYLVRLNLKGRKKVLMSDEIVKETSDKYLEAFRILTGKTLREAVPDLPEDPPTPPPKPTEETPSKSPESED